MHWIRLFRRRYWIRDGFQDDMAILIRHSNPHMRIVACGSPLQGATRGAAAPLHVTTPVQLIRPRHRPRRRRRVTRKYKGGAVHVGLRGLGPGPPALLEPK